MDVNLLSTESWSPVILESQTFFMDTIGIRKSLPFNGLSLSSRLSNLKENAPIGTRQISIITRFPYEAGVRQGKYYQCLKTGKQFVNVPTPA